MFSSRATENTKHDFHYCGKPGFSLVSVPHPRRPGRPPWTHNTPQPHSAPRAVCTFYIVLFTILFTTLRFPKSTATPDHGVGGFRGPAATCADPGREMGPQLSRREGTHGPRKTANVQAVCECVRDCPGSSGCFIFWDLSKFSNPKICARHSSTPKHRYRDNLDAGGPIFDQKWSPE